MASQRNSSVELLRIFAIFFIIMHHFSIASTIEPSAFQSAFLYSFNVYWNQVFNGLGKIGVNLFILISGYFLCNNTSFKTKRTLDTYLKVFMWSMIFMGLQLATGFSSPTSSFFITSFTPIISLRWWFMSSYLVIFLLHPLINKLINKLNKTSHILVTVLLLVFWMFTRITYSVFIMNSIPWFVIVYFIGAYIKKYLKMDKLKAWILIIATAALYLLFAYVNTFDFIGDGVTIESTKELPYIILGLSRDFSFLNLLLSITLFIAFIVMKPFYNKFINILGKCTFGVYLIHSSFVVEEYIFNNLAWSYVLPWYPLILFGVSITILLGCSLVDYLYTISIGKGLSFLLDKLDKVFSKVDTFLNKLFLIK